MFTTHVNYMPVRRCLQPDAPMLEKLWGAILNALVFVTIIVIMTFILVMLFKYGVSKGVEGGV